MKKNKFVNKPLGGTYDPEIVRSLSWTDDIQTGPGQAILLDKYLVDVEFFNRIVEQYREIRPNLMSTCVYEPIDLIGREFSSELTAPEKRLALLCLEHMASLPDTEFFDCSMEDSEPSFMLA